MRAHVLGLLTLVAVSTGCFIAPAGTNGGDGGGDPGDPNDPGASDGGTGALGAGLPCDVKAVLVSACVSCHGAPPSQGAPIALTSYADLTAPSKTHAGKTVADVCLQRMQDTSSPMPPGQIPSAADVATLDKWIKAGMPKGTCGGAATDAGPTGPDPYNTPVQCTSNKKWTGGDNGSSSMRPGGACVTCHKLGGKASGKGFDIAGTVYPTAHEPDDYDAWNGAPLVQQDIAVAPAAVRRQRMKPRRLLGREHGKGLLRGDEAAVTAGQNEGHGDHLQHAARPIRGVR